MHDTKIKAIVITNYLLNPQSDYKDINYPTLENCLFGSVKLTKNADFDKYGYFGYDIGFNRHHLSQLVMKLVKI